jgi:DNA-directed RNA polymerase III subunit RPC1
LLVEGYGLKEVLGIEGIDGKRTRSNHVLESLSTLGIESARQVFFFFFFFGKKKLSSQQ